MSREAEQRRDRVVAIGAPRHCRASEGKHWISLSWGLFKRSWLEFLLAFVIMLMVQLLLGNIPILGGFLTYLLMPVLTAGFIYMAHKARLDEGVGLGDLFIGFSTSLRGRQGQLLTLGMVSIAFNILLGIAFVMAVAATVQVSSLPNMTELSAMDIQQQQQVVEQLLMGVLQGMNEHALELLLLGLATALLAVLYGCAMWLAVPLVWLSHIGAWQAMRLSLQACKKNVGALTVFGILAVVLCLVAAIPFGLGLLIALPVLMLASYAAYVRIYASTSEHYEPTVMV